MRRRGRAFDVVMVLALGAFVAVEIIGPAAPAPGASPADTFTHVEMVVDDGGLHVAPDSVAAGIVEFEVTDARTDRTRPLRVRSVPPPINLGAGTQRLLLRVLRSYALSAYEGDTQLPGGTFLSIIVPQLAAPREPVHTVTVDVEKGGISTPYRESRFEQPLIPFTDNAPPDSQPWTTVTAGPTKLVVRNKSGEAIRCSVPNGDRVPVVRRNHRSTIRVTLSTGGPNFAVLTCASGTQAQQFDFWTAS